MDPQEFAQKMSSAWEQEGQGSQHLDIRLTVSEQGYALRDLKSGQEETFTSPEEATSAFTALCEQGRSKITS